MFIFCIMLVFKYLVSTGIGFAPRLLDAPNNKCSIIRKNLIRLEVRNFWFKSFLRTPSFLQSLALTPLKVRKKLFRLWGSWYSNRPTWTHGFSAKIIFEKYATSPEISSKMCPILLVWFGRPILDTFLVISWDSVHIFQNRFLCWNRESKSVDLNTMNPIIETIFFSPLKGSEPSFRGNWGGLRKLRFGWNFFCKLIILFLMGKWFVFIHFWHLNFFGQP